MARKTAETEEKGAGGERQPATTRDSAR